jgi:predicted FMN-binding regulatory protein PaiB
MYLPTTFAVDDRDSLFDFVEAHPFATVCPCSSIERGAFSGGTSPAKTPT